MKVNPLVWMDTFHVKRYPKSLSKILRAVILLPILLFAGCGGESSVEPIEDFNRPSGTIILSTADFGETGSTNSMSVYDFDSDQLTVPEALSAATRDRLRLSPSFSTGTAFLLLDRRAEDTVANKLLYFASPTARPIPIPHVFDTFRVSVSHASVSSNGQFIYLIDNRNFDRPARLVEVAISSLRARVLIDSVPSGPISCRPQRNQFVIHGFRYLADRRVTILYNADGSIADDLTGFNLNLSQGLNWSPDGRFLAGARETIDDKLSAMVVEVDTRVLHTGVPLSVASSIPLMWDLDSRSLVLWAYSDRNRDSTIRSGRLVVGSDTLQQIIPDLGRKVTLLASSQNGRFLVFADFSSVNFDQNDYINENISTVIYDRRKQAVVRRFAGILPIRAFR